MYVLRYRHNIRLGPVSIVFCGGIRLKSMLAVYSKNSQYSALTWTGYSTKPPPRAQINSVNTETS